MLCGHLFLADVSSCGTDAMTLTSFANSYASCNVGGRLLRFSLFAANLSSVDRRASSRLMSFLVLNYFLAFEPWLCRSRVATVVFFLWE